MIVHQARSYFYKKVGNGDVNKEETNLGLIPRIPLPFKEVGGDVLKVGPPPKAQAKDESRKRAE
jgi:hypothetical protein